MPAIPEEITQLLLSWSNGDDAALEQLIPLVYPELKRVARRYMGRESPGHTLQTSALINEAYLQLVDQQAVKWQDRAHFFRMASRVMRNILIDHARKHGYQKRGAGAIHVALDDVTIAQGSRAAELVALDDALTALAAVDPRKVELVELRFFGGLTVDETAEVMGLSSITIKREWRSAKAWLQTEISGTGSDLPT